MRKVTTDDSMVDRLVNDVRKGSLVKFETSSWSPSTAYLVREYYPDDLYPRNDDWSMESLSLLSKRGSEYAILWERRPAQVWLGYVKQTSGMSMVDSRSRITGLKVLDEEPDLHDYLPPRMVDMWPYI